MGPGSPGFKCIAFLLIFDNIILLEPFTEEELVSKQDWLKSNRAPIQKIFELLDETLGMRQRSIKANTDFVDIIKEWPRLFDIDGAVR